MKNLSFKNRNEIKLVGVLEEVSSKGKPIVILCHGWNSHKNKNSYTDFVDEFNKKGISSFRFDFFGQGESEGEFDKFTFEEGKENIIDVVKFLESKGFSKFILYGSSFGGICAIKAALELDNLICLTLSAPGSGSRDYSDLFEKTKKIEIPVFLIQGDKDETVNIEKTKKLVEYISDLTFEIIKSGDHRFTNKEHYNKRIKDVVSFIEKHI